jgi:hypothetical protein
MENTVNFGDRSKNLIDVSEDFDLQYWCARFSVTPEKLKSAIKAICNCAADQVKAYLESHR